MGLSVHVSGAHSSVARAYNQGYTPIILKCVCVLVLNLLAHNEHGGCSFSLTTMHALNLLNHI